MAEAHEFDYDLFVIGGGSGGLACSKQAASHGAKVAVADFVKPSPAGTAWGLGGTCVNVGCIPKKLMHIAALNREGQADGHHLGWDIKASHSWSKMVSNINAYIRDLNRNYKTELRSKRVEYFNAFATFEDPHTLKLEHGDGTTKKLTANKIVLATGGRPNLGGYEGAEECCISSDDIFWKKTPPGKTLVVGASYIALECAGFLSGLGFDVTVMVRSILLRGFDQDMANRIGEFMEKHGTKFEREKVPDKFEKTEDGKVRVFVKGQEFGVYDTVLLAIGRTGCAGWLNLEAAGLEYNAKTGKIKVDKLEQSSVPHIYGIGDVLEGQLELTPVAIQAGRLLADRLFGGKTKEMDYVNVATTVFTPIEYGACGLSEEDAKEMGDCRVYHTFAKPLEWNVSPDRAEDKGYMKVICNAENKVVGVHILGPHSGEVIQGLAVAMKAGITKEHLDDTVGIHPTFAESYTTLTELKVEGEVLEDAGGC